MSESTGTRAGEKVAEAIHQRMEGNQPAASANLEHARTLGADAVREKKDALVNATTSTPPGAHVLGTQHNIPPAEQIHHPTLTETMGDALHNLKEGVVSTGSKVMEGLKNVTGMNQPTETYHEPVVTTTGTTMPTSEVKTTGYVPGSTHTEPVIVAGKPVVQTRMQEQTGQRTHEQ